MLFSHACCQVLELDGWAVAPHHSRRADVLERVIRVVKILLIKGKHEIEEKLIG